MTNFTMYQESLQDIFSRMKNIVTKNNGIRPIFKGIHFIATPDSKILAEAINGASLCTIAYRLDKPPKKYCDFVIEPFDVPKLQNTVTAETVEVTIDEKTVDFKFPLSGITKTAPKLEGNFLDIARALPDNNPDLQIDFNADYIMDAVKAVKAAKREKEPITLSIFGKNSLATCTVSCDSRFCMVLPVRQHKTPDEQDCYSLPGIIRISKDIDTANENNKEDK